MKTYIEIGDKKYSVTIIDTEQGIIVTEGYFDEDDNYIGGIGNYFYYEGTKKKVELTDELINKLSGNDVPTIDWLKANIQKWLTSNGISWTTSMNKDELINLI